MLELDISKESVKETRKKVSCEKVLSVELMLKKELNTEPYGKGFENSKYCCAVTMAGSLTSDTQPM